LQKFDGTTWKLFGEVISGRPLTETRRLPYSLWKIFAVGLIRGIFIWILATLRE